MMEDTPVTPADESVVEFNPSAEFHVVEGPRDIGLCFVGDGFVAGYGDPKALGWVSRVVGRSPVADADLTAYNLGVRGQSSADVMARWRTECTARIPFGVVGGSKRDRVFPFRPGGRWG